MQKHSDTLAEKDLKCNVHLAHKIQLEEANILHYNKKAYNHKEVDNIAKLGAGFRKN
jgi:hypothetical protein